MDVIFKLCAGLLGHILVEEEREFTTAIVDFPQDQTAQASVLGGKGCGVLPPLLGDEDAAMREPHCQCGVDIQYGSIEPEDGGLALRIGKVRILTGELRWKHQKLAVISVFAKRYFVPQQIFNGCDE